MCVHKYSGSLEHLQKILALLKLELDGHKPLVRHGLDRLGQGGGDGEDALLGQGRAHQVRVDPAWKCEALVEALRGVASPVRRLLLVGCLHLHRVVDGLDHQLLRLVALHVHEDLVRVVVVLDSRHSVLLAVCREQGSVVEKTSRSLAVEDAPVLEEVAPGVVEHAVVLGQG